MTSFRESAAHLLLLYALITEVALCRAEHKPVVVGKGHNVVAGTEYKLMLTYQWPDGGEYAPGKTSNMTCPVSVVRDLDSVGELVRILPTSGRHGVIYENETVEISFVRKIKCAESLKWIIVKERGEDFWSLGLGSAEKDHPGGENLNGSFKIQTSHVFADSYKFMFCPNGATCGHISGMERLFFTYNEDSSPVPFGFVPKV